MQLFSDNPGMVLGQSKFSDKRDWRVKRGVRCLGVSVILLLGYTFDTYAVKQSDLERLINTGECRSCDLRDADLSGENLADVNLARALLSGANFRGSMLQRANLNYTDLKFSDLSDTDLSGATLLAADLFGATLDRAIIRDANLAFAVMGRIKARNADLSGSKLVVSVL